MFHIALAMLNGVGGRGYWVGGAVCMRVVPRTIIQQKNNCRRRTAHSLG